MCNGADLDGVLFYLDGVIDRVGWAVVPVHGCCPAHSWAYTIGLTDYDHPEIAVVGLAAAKAGPLLDRLTDLVIRGFEPTAPSATYRVDGKLYEFAEVHPKHFRRDTFALLNRYYKSLEPPEVKPTAIEVYRTGQRPKLHDGRWGS
jgi:hypothetical protein